MARAFTPKVVTANRLLEGDAVWLTEEDTWSTHMRDAELIEDEAVATDRLLYAQSRPHEVVGPYLADAKEGAEGPEPVHFREAFRNHGPSNYALGKQTEA